MKRSEMQVGEEYAVVAPSQNLDSPYVRVKHIRILDLAPKFRERYTGFFSSYDKVPEVEVTGFDGEPITVKDRSDEAYDEKEGKKYVKALIVNTTYYGDQPDPYIGVVPVTQVRMSWADFEKRNRSAKRKANKEQRERDAEIDDFRRQANRLKRLENVAGIDHVELNEYQGTLRLTFDQYEMLLKKVSV